MNGGDHNLFKSWILHDVTFEKISKLKIKFSTYKNIVTKNTHVVVV